MAISKLAKGDKVRATNTRTGRTTAQTVAAVWVHHDRDLYDLTIRAGGKTATIRTTRNHLFWDPSLDHGLIPANHLKPGDHLKTPDGQSAVVVGGSVPPVHDGWMWDLTVPGNNDHDFYVIPAQAGIRDAYHVEAGATSVLVHNDSCPTIRTNESGIQHVLDRHFSTGDLSAGKSLFNDSELAHQLVTQAEGTPFVFEQGNGRFQFVVPDAGRAIGVDRATGLATRTYAVVTDANGNLITIFPGLPGQLGTPITGG